MCQSVEEDFRCPGTLTARNLPRECSGGIGIVVHVANPESKSLKSIDSFIVQYTFPVFLLKTVEICKCI